MYYFEILIKKILSWLYRHGVASDCFTLILQGRVEVTVGVENIVFEDGPFSVFGVHALLTESGGPPFLPDYAVRAITNVQYLRIRRSLYRSAVRASKMERENKTPDNYQEFDEIFWNDVRKSGGSAAECSPPAGLEAAASVKSGGGSASDGGTPSRLSYKRKSSILSKLTPKFDRKRASPGVDVASANKDRKRRNELSSSSMENPLIGGDDECGGGGGYAEAAAARGGKGKSSSVCSQENPLLSECDGDPLIAASETPDVKHS